MADLKAYLAERYMTGAVADAILDRTEGGKRRKKRKVDSHNSERMVIADDDGGWTKDAVVEDDTSAPGTRQSLIIQT